MDASKYKSTDTIRDEVEIFRKRGKEGGSPYICEYNDHFLAIKVNVEKFEV